MKDNKKNINLILIKVLIVLAFTALMAVFIGVFLTPFKLIEFINVYSSTAIVNFNGIFSLLLDISFSNIALTLVAIILISVTAQFVITIIKEDKINIKNFSKKKAYVNKVNFITFLFLIISWVVWLILNVLLSAILFGMHVVLSDIGYSPLPLNYALSVVVSVAIYFAFVAIQVILIQSIKHFKNKRVVNIKRIMGFVKAGKFEMRETFVLIVAINIIIIPTISLSMYWEFYQVIEILAVFVIINYYCFITLFNKKIKEKLMGKTQQKNKEKYGKDKSKQNGKTRKINRTKKA